MCYRLYLATPLTLSEVRSMLPPGVTADVAEPAAQRRLRHALPSAQTVVELRRGACGCDFVLQRDPAGRRDETRLRAAGLRARVARAELAAMIERHRRGAAPGAAPLLSETQRALAGFVAEHARNAGPAVYELAFASPPGPRAAGPGDPVVVPVSAIAAAPGEWLAREQLSLVVRG